MRLFIKILAVVVGFFGISFALGGLLFMGMVASGSLDSRLHRSDTGIFTFFLAAAAITGVLGYLFLREAWRHLRRPDRRSASHVVKIASFLFGAELSTFAHKFSLLPKPGGTWGPTIELLWALGILLVCYLFYRLALKPIAAQAFQDTDASPTPTTPGSTP